MPASFWFDLRGEEGAAEGYPRLAVKALYSKDNRVAKPELYRLYADAQLPIPKNINIRPKQALYMKGTNDELRQALDAANKLTSVLNFSIDEGLLAIWYIRRQDDEIPVPETIVCIAGRGDGPSYYWNIRNDQTQVDRGPPANHWKEMKHSEERSVTLRELVDTMLPRLNEEAAWYPGFPTEVSFPALPTNKVIWHWQNVDEALGRLVQSDLKDNYVHSTVMHPGIYVGEDNSYSVTNSDAEFHGVQLIRSAIIRDYGPSTADFVFGTIGITNDRDGLKAGQIPALRGLVGDISDVPRFGYHSLRRANQTGKFFDQYNLEFFYVVRSRDIKPTTDQSKWTYTGDKVHLSVRAEEVQEAWNLVLPILIGHRNTIKEFKVTDMENTKKHKDVDEKARRVYNGAQITINLHADPGGINDAAHRFAAVLKEVSSF